MLLLECPCQIGGPFLSSNEVLLFFPGLKLFILFLRTLELIESINDPNPIMFFEHKALYRSCSEMVSDNYFSTKIGVGNLLKNGNDVSIVTYGLGVHWAIEVLNNNPAISADLIDLRTLVPLDKEMIFESVKKTGKVIILHEDCMIGEHRGRYRFYDI